MQMQKVVRDGLEYALNEAEMISFVISNKSKNNEIFIPRLIYHDMHKYVVKKIVSGAFENSTNVKSIQFAEDSELQIIEQGSFTDSSIESISIPSSVTELEEGWCCGTPNLINISISPKNHLYSIFEDKYIIGKSNSEKENFDVLIFCVRNIKIAKIPSFIETIGPYAFNECHQLQKIEISDDSKLKKIDDYAFCNCSINDVFIPSHITSIGECAFASCSQLHNFDFSIDSKIQTIEKYTFSFSSIDFISIPSSVTKICEYAFSSCINLHQIEIPENSELQTIEKLAFFGTPIKSISIPPKVTCLENGWCFDTNKILKVTVMPNNKLFSSYEDKLIIKKSDEKNENYNVLVIAIKSIKNIKIPSFIEIIKTSSFENCYELQNIEFSNDSQLQTIEINAFCNSAIESISIPSKLVNLEDGWCNRTPKLVKITIMPNNQRYSLYEDKFIIGKSNIKNENFDVLVFSNRNIKEAKIPDFIEIISPFSFEDCYKLQKITFSMDSKLQKIGKFAFCNSTIESIFFPPSLTQIGESAFSCCDQFKRIEITDNSKLQIIEKDAFHYSSIKCVYIPPLVSEIGEYAFYYCENLQVIEFDENSRILQFSQNLFIGCNDLLIMIPTKLSMKLKIIENVDN